MPHEHDPILLVARELCGIREQLVQQNNNNAILHRLAKLVQQNNNNAILHRLAKMENRIMMNAQQLEALLNNQTTQIGKIAKEQSDRFDALVAANKVLQDLIDAGGVTPAIEAAADNVQTALDSLDASIPDAPAAPKA